MAYPYDYGGSEPKSGAGTAITAGLLALLDGIFLALVTGGAAIAYSQERRESAVGSDDAGIALSMGLGAGPAAILLFIGAILLFARRRAGRALLIGTPLFAMLYMSGWLIYGSARWGVHASDLPSMAAVLSVFIAVQALVLCFAILGSTGRWVTAGRRPPRPYY